MTTVAYPLGTPPAAALRGGDCSARDLDQARNITGPHHFAATTHCQINNGLLRLTVGASGAAPTLTVEARRGRVTIGDVYVDTYADLYGGETATPEWLAMGTLAIDSPSVPALLTTVRLVRTSPEAITIRLVAPLMADAFVTLRRGRRAIDVQHGSSRPPAMATLGRRIRWTASPSPVGTAGTSRVEEVSPAAALDGLMRFVGAVDTATANAGAFSVTASSATTARFGAGVGTYAWRDKTRNLLDQLGDASRPRLVVA